MSNAVNPNDPAVSGNTMTDGDFERLLDELHGDGVPRAVVDLAAADDTPSVDRSVLNRTMADEDFDRLLEADNESQASNAEVPHDDQSAPQDTQAKPDGEVAEDMGQEHLTQARSGAEESEPEPQPAAPQGGPDLITDDEFENLLDELHGAGGAPGSAGTAPAAENALPDAPLESMPHETANTPDGEPHDWVELILDPTMVIAQVGELHERLCSLREEQNTVGVAANEVNVIDTANLQLLYAFMRDRAAHGNETLIHKPSEAFINAASSLGMLELIGLDAQ